MSEKEPRPSAHFLTLKAFAWYLAVLVQGVAVSEIQFPPHELSPRNLSKLVSWDCRGKSPVISALEGQRATSRGYKAGRAGSGPRERSQTKRRPRGGASSPLAGPQRRLHQEGGVLIQRSQTGGRHLNLAHRRVGRYGTEPARGCAAHRCGNHMQKLFVPGFLP